MSKTVRKTFLPFGFNAGVDQIEQFGSLATGIPDYSTDPAVIQSLSAWLEGWFGAVVGANSPAIEDMNAVFFVYAYMIFYMFEMGIPEWDSATTYYENSFVQYNGVLYQSQVDNNLNHEPDVSPTQWGSPFQPSQVVFTASGTWTAPAGVTAVDIIADFPSQANDFNYDDTDNCGTFGLIDPEGTMWVWGSGGNSTITGVVLGNSVNAPVSQPVVMAGVPMAKWRQVFIGVNTAGAIDQFGNLYCWGSGGVNAGVIGNGTSGVQYSSPVAVLGLARFSKFANGSFSNGTAGAIDYNGQLWMWGNNVTFGQLGVGDVTNRSSPTMVLGAHNFVVSKMFGNGTYALDSSKKLWAWGRNTHGELGLGDVIPRSSPVAVLGNISFQEFECNNTENVLALDVSGNIWGWGNQVPNNTNNSYSSPVMIAGSTLYKNLIKGATALGPSWGAVDTAGNIWIWGDNSQGQAGQGNLTATGYSSPVKVIGGVSYAYVFTAFNEFTNATGMFGLDVSGNIWAWGNNERGMLGANFDPGAVAAVSSPVMVVGGNVWKYLWAATGIDNSSNGGCTLYALDQYGQIWAWGNNVQGQVGDGTATDRSSPVLVAGPVRPMVINPYQKRLRMTVSPGTTYAVNVGWACTFGGEIVAYAAKQLTVSFTG